nr:MAG TPA: ASCH domain protein [Caudoviricetes sp.]
MKVITIWQPWASLIACGAKEFETRGWATSYRGPIAIHSATLSPFKAIRDVPIDAVCKMREALKERGILPPFTNFKDLPLGHIIATGELVGCHKIVLHGGRGLPSTAPGWLETYRGIYEPSERELLFGDWTPGRYAWELQNVKMLDTPIPAKGKQRIWNWEESA